MVPSLAEVYKIADAMILGGPVTTNGAPACRYITTKSAHLMTLHLQFTQAVGHATLITFQESPLVSGVGAQTVANPCAIWSNILGTVASDTLIRRADATTYALSTGVLKMMVEVQFNPAALSAGFPCVGFTLSDSSQATNFVCGSWFVNTRFQQATPPSVLLD